MAIPVSLFFMQNLIKLWFAHPMTRKLDIDDLEMLKLMMPVRYLMSGGVTSRDLLPAWMYSVCDLIEHILKPWINQTAMFAIICLKRTT
jgi:hypothetical protein